MKKAEKYIVPAATIIVGLFFAVYCHIKYEFYSPTQGPMPGFMPEIIGILMVFTGILALIQAKDEPDKELNLKNFSIVIALGLVLIGNFLIGTLVSIGLFLLGWLKFVAKYDWKTTIFVFAIIMAFVVGVFKIWMDIPFVPGILFEMIFDL